MKRTIHASVFAIALVVGAIASAQANTTITTSRVQVTMRDNGSVQVRTGSPTNVTQGITPATRTMPSASAVRTLACSQQRQRSQDYAVMDNGDRVISQSQSRVMVCQ